MRATLLLSAATVVLLGAGLTTQAVVNARLGERAGHPLNAAAISFAVGLAALVAAALAARIALPAAAPLASMPWWYWTGGPLGAAYIAAAVVLAPRVGAGVFFALLVAGQLASAVLIEHFGWMGAARQPLTLPRLLGIACIVLGVALVRWKK
jgi:bacterial/archaeal transporter family-2 protein